MHVLYKYTYVIYIIYIYIYTYNVHASWEKYRHTTSRLFEGLCINQKAGSWFLNSNSICLF